MPDLPVSITNPVLSGQSRQIGKAVKAKEQTELAVYEHQLVVFYQREIERVDAEALGEAVRHAIEEEVGVLDFGLSLAGGSPAKAELVSRLVSLQSKIDTARIARHYGG